MQTRPVARGGSRVARRPISRGCAGLSAGLIFALLLILGGVAIFAAWILLDVALKPYEGRIYPNVYVSGVDLGGLTAEEAALRLAEVAAQYEGAEFVLRDGERAWSVPWVEMGISLDVEGTVQQALAAGRADSDWKTLLGILFGRYEVSPLFTVDPDAARAALERLGSEVSVPPVDATLRLEEGRLIPVPGQPGRALDVEATLETVVNTVTYLGPDSEVALAFRSVPPRVADARPALAEAEEMLGRSLTLTAYDVLTDETFTWTLGREEIAAWLRVGSTEDGMGIRVEVDPEAVRATLADLAAGMGEERGFRLEEAVPSVIEALEAGGGSVPLYVTHPTRVYTVQAGDRLTTIAAKFGMPPGLIAEANPGVDLDWLWVGQQLTIPSQDILTPYIPVPGKRIVINIAEQRMRVYENGQLLYEWPVSTGIPSSPTYRGIFQVLGKEENAYASQWDLWMPYFLAVYRAGGDVYNGIHALPILSNGQRLWEGLLGSPASYGCIILGEEEAKILYDWADVGVLVIIE